MARLIILFVFCISTINAKCQNEIIALKTMAIGDSVLIRWVPKNFQVWQLANRYGYKVERILLSKNGNIAKGNKITLLHDGVITPLHERSWKPIVKLDTVFAPVALQALYGESFELSTSFKNNIMEAYNKVKENDLRFGFAMYCADRSLIVSKALGLYFVDKRIKKDERYIYKVYINGLGENGDTAYAIVNPMLKSKLTIPQKVRVFNKDNVVLLNWMCLGNDYVGYMVERSLDGKTFKQINKDLVIPFENKGHITAYYKDSLKYKQIYYYRVIGMTPFENFGPYSDTVRVAMQDAVAAPSNLEAAVLNGRVRLTWNNTEKESTIRHFKIKRSSSANGTYSMIGKTSTNKQTVWDDNSPLPSGYYKVVAVSSMGVESESLEAFVQLDDDTPPTIPSGLSGIIDSLGVVTLKWNSNQDDDLLGYRIYRANNIKGEYTQVNKSVIKNVCFTDTINIRTLTKEVAYKLAAVDNRYNSSNFSDPTILHRPDMIKPAPPILKLAENIKNGICLKWISSPSNDVYYYNIIRRNCKDSVVLFKVDGKKCDFTDSTTLNIDRKSVV